MYAHKGKSNGTFNVTVAGEPRNFTSASVSIACGPIGCGQQVVFETELEDLVKHVIGVSYVYQSAPGTYEVIPGQYSAPGGDTVYKQSILQPEGLGSLCIKPAREQ